MYIHWLGHSCFKLQNKKTTVVIDPYNKDIGFKMPKAAADIVLVSHDHIGHHNIQDVKGISSDPFVISSPGEYEVGGVFIYGTSFFHDASEGKDSGTINGYKVEMDNVSILHLGDLGHVLTDEQVSRLGNVDILLIPVGGHSTIGAKEATELVNKIEPRIVIPMHYKMEGLKFDLDPVDKFLKEMGATKAETMPKLKVDKKDLPQEETRVILLEK